MANMSYCRFNNTRLDMYDCLNAIGEIQDGEESKLSEHEADAGEDMFKAILEFCVESGIIEDYDRSRLTELFEELYGEDE